MRQPLLINAAEPTETAPPPRAPITDVLFRCGDRKKLCVGNKPLRTYLLESGQGIFVRIAGEIDQLDVRALTATYSPIGRHAIHPRIVLGLIVLGILLDKASLRDLEHLAICDVRAWWICGGEQPDHSTIGKFIVTHAEWIEGEGFQAILTQLVGRLGLQRGNAAVDGTVIESAASRLNLLKKDAARQAAKEAADEAAEAPDDARAQRAAECAQQVAEAAQSRTDAREAHGRPADHLRVAATDPDAVNQPRKDGVVAPSYKPSILANEAQFIVGQHVNASNEIAALEPLLEQHVAALGGLPDCLMADAGYYAISVLELALERDIDILCPSGKATSAHDVDRTGKTFTKHLFAFQPNDNTYRCPAGHSLVAIGTEHDRDGRTLTKFGNAPCSSCPERTKCTTAKTGRTIKRYDGDELKEAQREVMHQPAALAKYRQRSAMVEPVFGRLREMGLRRFRRRGLVRVRAEFSLYCIAYNLKRADAVREARIAAFAIVRVSGRPIALVVCFATITL